jgi:hypothetical protein
VTSQQTADLALAQWQALRGLPPDERIEALMASFFLPPSETDMEYEITLRNVATEMQEAT